MSTSRRAHTAAVLANGKVLIAGGTSNGSDFLDTAELYDPHKRAFTATGSLPLGLVGATATAFTSGPLAGKVLVAGGGFAISELPCPLGTPALGFGSSLVPFMDVTSDAELYDPNTGAFTPAGTMTSRRMLHQAVLLAGGEVLMAGGADLACPGSISMATAETYDPAGLTFSATGNMNAPRAVLSAALLNDGEVLIAGGVDSNGDVLSSAELYDPATRSFTATGSMTIARAAQTATLLSNGEVLVAGGFDATLNPLSSAELYDPATGTFSATGAMAAGHAAHTATLLDSGRVLIAGGGTAAAELYDPLSGRFAPTGRMTTARSGQTATPLR